MPSYLQIENISKSYGPKVLFENIAFNINEGDKIALIAPNGTGKTSLLKILAGKDKSDSGGSIKFLRDVRISFLEQEYSFNPGLTVWQQLFPEGSKADFDLEIRTKRYLSDLKLSPDQQMGSLSGGEVKRVAIAQMLASDADFLIMDEPTNHLDVDAIEYLENFLKRSRCTLFMVTHDRYFLDRVCNTVMEMDHGSIYIYRGDYENYLEKRAERIANYNAETDKVRNILRRELEWMHATPCARSGKAKYRKQAFWDLKARADRIYTTQEVSMDDLRSSTRLGSKIIDCKDLSFSYRGADGDLRPVVSHFTYNFQRYERVGIVGANGIGKSTFLSLLLGGAGEAVRNGAVLSGTVETGESVKAGWYRQTGMEFDSDETVLDIVPNTYLLGKFLFPHDMYYTPVSRLSGGEKRRLYLLTVLMQEPNLLVLDEPTNDLDIVTLNILEEYLLDFKGTLVIVTHDRHFLDRLVDHLLVFCGDGQIKDFIGGYTEYRSFMADLEEERRREERAASEKARTKTKPVRDNGPRKLSYKEKRELESLEARISSLEEEKAGLEALLAGGTADYAAIASASARYAELKDELDTAEMRWLELSEDL